MGQVAAVGQVHAQDRVAQVAQGLIDRVVGVGAAVGLDIGMVRAEELAGPLPGDVLHHVHALAAAVVPLAGVALGVLVGEHRGRGSQHRLAHKFSEAMSSMFLRWRSYSDRTAAPTSGSCAARNSMISFTMTISPCFFVESGCTSPAHRRYRGRPDAVRGTPQGTSVQIPYGILYRIDAVITIFFFLAYKSSQNVFEVIKR